MLVIAVFVISNVFCEECPSLCSHEERIGLLEFASKQTDSLQSLQVENFKLQSELTKSQTDVDSIREQTKLCHDKFTQQTEALQTCQTSLPEAAAAQKTAEQALETARKELKLWLHHDSDGLRAGNMAMVSK